MDADALEALLHESRALPRPPRDPELDSIATAILLEDELDVTLTDADIVRGGLDDPATVRAVLAERRRGA